MNSLSTDDKLQSVDMTVVGSLPVKLLVCSSRYLKYPPIT